ncbi:MAG TPA: glycosyltransferase [Chthoniobacteraceae bacterium]|jgi:glycosyltransferase involved in cell wall biosynthesis|nr:glycosyltransferase [Chthoniobacteraceae bacterium]
MRILALPAFKNRRENPYNAALYFALQKLRGVSVAEFSNARLFTGRWDILHIHWPDAPLHRRSAMSAALYALLLIIRVRWARMMGTKIVWTVHNLRSHHTAHPRVERWLWKKFVPLVDGCIHLSHAGKAMALESIPALAGKSHSVVPHGHYRGFYRDECERGEARMLLGIRPDAPVIAFVGQIKAYKNVPGLIRAFIDAKHPRAVLLIAGRPGDAALEEELRAMTNHPRIICHFGLIPDHRMHLYLSACDLAVFPYREILNSGSAILSLSFNRPALVPARGAMAELRDMAGPEWVYTYDSVLTSPTLIEALEGARRTGRPESCNLAELDWREVAAGTLAAYENVLKGIERVAIAESERSSLTTTFHG